MLKRAKLNLCDLAGSEKIIDKTEKMTKAHFTELKTINLSLTTLGKVISALSKSMASTKPSKTKSSSNMSLYSKKIGRKFPNQ